MMNGFLLNNRMVVKLNLIFTLRAGNMVHIILHHIKKMKIMKKVLSILAASLIGVSAYSQAFWEYTSYAGAFAPSPTARWTDGWTSFDPQNVVYPSTTVTVNPGDITTNTTWTSGNTYLLNGGFVYVTNGATLTIEPGTVIRGTGNGTLIIEKGAKIYAQGTVNQPIVFTSNAPVGARDYGDWGGVVILGQAYNNNPNSPNVVTEGGIGNGTTGKGCHGGTNDADSSGVLSYVRIEFVGIPLLPNSEINGLTMGSVGSKTKIDHIQVSYSGDDSYEWFGGTVDCRNIVAFKGWDDDFDCDFGWRGRVQYAFSVRDSRYADQSGSNGFEIDNDASGSTRQPKTAAEFSNVTIIGPNWTTNPDSTNSLYSRAAHIRRNSAVDIRNSIFTGYRNAGFYLDGRKTTANYCGDTMVVECNLLAQMPVSQYFRLASNTDTLCITNVGDWRTLAVADNNDTLTTTTALMLGATFGNSLTDYDARPQAGSPALNHACWSWNSEFVNVEEQDILLESNIYPNPAEGFTNLSFDANAEGNLVINIIDLTGKIVRTMNNLTYAHGNNTYVLDVQGLSTGVYVVNLHLGNSVKAQKLIVK